MKLHEAIEVAMRCHADKKKAELVMEDHDKLREKLQRWYYCHRNSLSYDWPTCGRVEIMHDRKQYVCNITHYRAYDGPGSVVIMDRRAPPPDAMFFDTGEPRMVQPSWDPMMDTIVPDHIEISPEERREREFFDRRRDYMRGRRPQPGFEREYMEFLRSSDALYIQYDDYRRQPPRMIIDKPIGWTPPPPPLRSGRNGG